MNSPVASSRPSAGLRLTTVSLCEYHSDGEMASLESVVGNICSSVQWIHRSRSTISMEG